MQTGRKYNKTLTSTQGQGLSQSAASNQKNVQPDRFTTATAGNVHYKGEDDSSTVLTGPGGGDYVATPQINPERFGYFAASGSRFEINDAVGSERVEIVHHSGAAITIDPDGAVYLSSTSARGAGISAPKGDVYISAGGDLVYKGTGSVTIDTAGDATWNVGGTLNIRAGAYKLTTQTMDETIDGSASRSVTNDQSVVVGGINRKTVASDDREQVSGKKIVDVAGSYNNKTDGDYTSDVGGKSSHTIAGDHLLSTQGDTSIKSGGSSYVDSGIANRLRAGTDTLIHSGAQIAQRAGSIVTIDGGTHIGLTAAGNLVAQGQNVALASGALTQLSSVGTIKAMGSIIDISGTSTKLHGGTLSVVGGTTTIGSPGPITIATPMIIGPVPTGAAGSATPIVDVGSPVTAPAAPEGPTAPKAPEEAQTPAVNDVVDELTSARKYPEYTGNGVTEGAGRALVGMTSNDTEPQAEDVYNEYSSKNTGNINPSYPGGSYDTLPEEPVNRSEDIQSEQPETSVPSRHNLNTKISKYFTLAELVNANHSGKIPPDMWDEVVKMHILLAVNVLDPLKEKFPDMIITNAWRNSRPNHITGRAADIVCQSRSMTIHAEMARFARDNLPVDQVLLEKNDTGKSHLHLRVSPAGQKGNPVVITCGDKKCISKTPGIDVEYLVRRGTK